MIVEGLFAALTNVNFDNDALLAIMECVDAEKRNLVPECFKCASSCGRNNDYDMSKLWNADEDIRFLKSLILFGIRGVAAYAYNAAVLGYKDESIHSFPKRLQRQISLLTTICSSFRYFEAAAYGGYIMS